MNTALRRRLTFWAPFLLVLLLVLGWLFRPQAIPVDTVTVERGPLSVSVSDEGETRVRDVFVVSAPIPGFMRRIELEVGDPVEAQKTVIARIEPNDPEFLDPRSVAVARAGRDAAAAARDYARAQLQRAVAERDFAALEYRAHRGTCRAENRVAERARCSGAPCEDRGGVRGRGEGDARDA